MNGGKKDPFTEAAEILAGLKDRLGVDIGQAIDLLHRVSSGHIPAQARQTFLEFLPSLGTIATYAATSTEARRDALEKLRSLAMRCNLARTRDLESAWKKIWETFLKEKIDIVAGPTGSMAMRAIRDWLEANGCTLVYFPALDAENWEEIFGKRSERADCSLLTLGHFKPGWCAISALGATAVARESVDHPARAVATALANHIKRTFPGMAGPHITVDLPALHELELLDRLHRTISAQQRIGLLKQLPPDARHGPKGPSEWLAWEGREKGFWISRTDDGIEARVDQGTQARYRLVIRIS